MISYKSNNQNGFTLIELLVALAIAAVIMAGVATTIYQLLSVQASSSNRMYAVRQVQNVGYWVSQDVQMAHNISFDDETTFDVTELLVLNWIEWDGSLGETVEYETRYVIDNGDMYRYVYEDGIETNSFVIAEDIKAGEDYTNGRFDTENRILIMTVTSEISGFGQASETRVYEVVPRSVL
jgi:prepilin-type N-terminal cleavage/methylation domain-containing protein